MASQKQIDANRRNASRSTGPVSEEGKKASRRNALKHGLSGAGVVLPREDAEAVNDRMAEWHSSLKPFDPYEMYLLEVVAVESLRIDRCHVHERVLHLEQTRRAADSWDADQRQKAADLIGRLSKNPGISARLESTVAGASLLLERWEALARVLDHEDWSADQESLAHDLLGTEPALREGSASPFFAASHEDAILRRREVTSTQITRLKRLIAVVLPDRDAHERELRKAGVPDLSDRSLLLLQRYESRCFRRLTWATKHMQSQHRTVISSTERIRETAYSRPIPDVKWPPDPPTVTSPPPAEPAAVPTANPTGPPVYRRPLLQHILSEDDLKMVNERMRENEAARKSSPSKPMRKNLPSTRDKPSRRAQRLKSSG